MSRKHYAATARVIRDNMERAAECSDPTAHAAAELCARAIALGMADVFAADNPRFDRERFLTACGV